MSYNKNTDLDFMTIRGSLVSQVYLNNHKKLGPKETVRTGPLNYGHCHSAAPGPTSVGQVRLVYDTTD